MQALLAFGWSEQHGYGRIDESAFRKLVLVLLVVSGAVFVATEMRSALT